jgi:polyisoprenoid-binding protein YceI
MAATETQQLIPTGNWQVDPVHTSARFSVRHLELTDFSGSLTDVGAELTVDDSGAVRLEGYAAVASIDLEDDQQRGHVLSPEFFDAEQYPRVTYTADSVSHVDGEIVIDGTLKIKDHSGSVRVRGSVSGPVEGFDSKRHIALELGATIDRTEYGLNWSAQTADGTQVLGDDVALSVHIELVEG